MTWAYPSQLGGVRNDLAATIYRFSQSPRHVLRDPGIWACLDELRTQSSAYRKVSLAQREVHTFSSSDISRNLPAQVPRSYAIVLCDDERLVMWRMCVATGLLKCGRREGGIGCALTASYKV